MTSPSSRFYKIKNYLPKDLQTFKVPVIQSKFSPIWGLPSIKIFEVMKKSLDWERCHVCKQERNFFNPQSSGSSSGSITPITALLRSLLADSRPNGLRKGKSICTSFAGTTWTQITLLSTSSYNICVVKLLLPFLQILRGA